MTSEKQTASCPKPQKRMTSILGWTAVILSTAVTCFWAFWGIAENFHEGWFYESIWNNLALMFGQYLILMLALLALTSIAIAWPRVGSMLHLGLALVALCVFGFSNSTQHFTAVPLILLALAYWFGRPKPRKWAYAVLIGATMITLVASGAEPVWRILVIGRENDGDFGARIVEGNGVTLVWAPEGPGWPREGISWDEAVKRCRYLSDDGLTLADEPQNLWRLPTADEAVRSMHRHGKLCDGEWDGESAFPEYRVKPDKETPLWNPHSPIIYRWTSTEIDSEHAYIICYNGQVRPRRKNWAGGSQSFRAVKNIREN